MEEVIETRVCTKCSERHPETFFNRDRSRPDGVYPQCKNCSRKACRRVYRKYHDKHLAMKREWKVENPERHSQINKTWRTENREKCCGYTKSWRKRHPEKVREMLRKYQRALRAATPPWVDAALIRMARKETPDGYVLDHIDPLQHEHLCGLNVPWNLQVLADRENASKGNKVDFENYKLVGEGGFELCATPW